MRRDANDRGAPPTPLRVPPRATETILSVAARCILSGSDGVTAREVADALTKMTCERARKSLMEGDVDHARERSAYEAMRAAAGRDGNGGWTTRTSASGTKRTDAEDALGATATREEMRETIFDFPGREYRPPRSWLGTGGEARKGKERRRRAPHASVREVLRMCRETQGADEAPREKVFGEAAASPEKRRAPRTANPLAELAEKERARAEAKAKSTAEGAGGETAAATTVVKKRRKDLANEKAGNHLALVSWIGEGKKDGVRRDRTFYEGFRREGVEFRNGDCVYCLPERTTENMYLAQIQRCFEDDDKSMMIECCWFMTQDEVRAWGGDLPPSTEPEEIFLGTSVDVNPIAALEGLAPVMTHDAFTASAPASASASARASSDDVERRLFARKCYVPVRGYDAKSKNPAQRKSGAFHPLDHVPGRGFVVLWPSSKKKKRKR